MTQTNHTCWCRRNPPALGCDCSCHQPLQQNYLDARSPEERAKQLEIEKTAITTVSQPQPAKEWWEESFEKEFSALSAVKRDPDGHPITDDLKSFVRRIAKEERQKGREEFTKNVNRVEVIDHTEATPTDFDRGRVYVKWEDKLKVETSLQDGERTLKIFITKP